MKIKKFYMAALAAAVLAGCSNDDEVAGVQKNVLPEDGVIRLEAGINGMNTRAVGYTTDELTELGLFVKNSNDTYTYNNVYMKKDGSGTWASYESDGTTSWMMLWQSESAAVNVTAYAPYDATATLDGTITGTVESNQTMEGNGRKSDALYAKSTVTPNAPSTSEDIYYNVDTQKLNVKMNHALSKLTVNIRYGTEMTQGDTTPSLASVTLGGTLTGYSLKLADGSVNASGSKPDIMMMLSDATVANYNKSAEAILVPQKAAFTITVIVDGRTFVYNNKADFDFNSGNAYTLNLLVGKDIVNIGGITASPWTTNEEGSLETE